MKLRPAKYRRMAERYTAFTGGLDFELPQPEDYVAGMSAWANSVAPSKPSAIVIGFSDPIGFCVLDLGDTHAPFKLLLWRAFAMPNFLLFKNRNRITKGIKIRFNTETRCIGGIELPIPHLGPANPC